MLSLFRPSHVAAWEGLLYFVLVYAGMTTVTVLGSLTEIIISAATAIAMAIMLKRIFSLRLILCPFAYNNFHHFQDLHDMRNPLNSKGVRAGIFLLRSILYTGSSSQTSWWAFLP